MELFITDARKEYDLSKSRYKIYLENFSIKESSFLDVDLTNSINRSTNAIEFEGGEKMSVLFDRFISNENVCKHTTNNPLLNGREKRDQLFSDYFPVMVYFFFYSATLMEFVNKLFGQVSILKKGVKKLVVNFPETYALIQCTEVYNIPFVETIEFIAGSDSKASNKTIKNLYYAVKKGIKQFSLSRNKSNSKKILLFVYDIPHHQKNLIKFLDLIKNDPTISLDIVYYNFNVQSDKSNSYFDLKGFNNVRSFLFEDFTCPGRLDYSNQIKAILKIYPCLNTKLLKTMYFGYSTKIAWMQNIFTRLKPDVCFQMSLHESGRIFSDVAFSFKVPSIQLDYAQVYDSYYLNSHIRFTARASTSEDVISIWKKRKDPTPFHHAIGYLKLDYINSIQFNKEAFFRRVNLNISQKTILFASTYLDNNDVYNIEKRELVSNLSTLCNANNWNLLIKKHPLEFDTILEEVIKANDFKNQIIVSDSDLNIYEAIMYSDLVTNQLSSIVLECLYLGKPFCFLTTNVSQNQTEISPMKNEAFFKLFTSMNDFEKFANLMFDPVKLEEFLKLMESRKKHYLFSTDGKSTERFLDLLKYHSEKKGLLY